MTDGAGHRTVPFHRVQLSEEDIEAVVTTLRTGWLSTGNHVAQLEEAMSEYLGVERALATSSGTAALHLMYSSAGLTPGDEVLIPTLTFTASASSAVHAGLKPVLVDVLPDSLALDPEDAARRTTVATKAVLAVHYAGVHSDVGLLRRKLDPSVMLFEDAAHALPCRGDAGLAGSHGRAAAFSFYATKTVTTGEGGMLVSSDIELMDRARLSCLHGLTRGASNRYQGGAWRYDVLHLGFKYNMTEVAGAIGLRQLQAVELNRGRRAAIAEQYDQALGESGLFQLPYRAGNARDSWHLYPLRLNLERLRCNRDEFIEQLKQRGVQASVHFIPLNLLTAYQQMGYRRGDFPVAEAEFLRLVSLPIWPTMAPADVQRVIEVVIDVGENNRA